MGTANPALLAQLEQVRTACFNDARNFAKAIPGVLHLIATGQPVEQRRWGSAFLAEAFASPLVSQEEKLNIALPSLATVQSYLEDSQEDIAVIRSAVLVATSMYPIIFRHIVYNGNDNITWQAMVSVKSSILRRMDSAASGVRVCCVKFVQRVVQVQTQGLISDPRRPEQNEVSLALVQNHKLLIPQNLEAEASGLLDRLLNVFHEVHSDPLYVTATLNCLTTLVRTRPSIANRILNTVFNFNPFQIPPGPVSAKMRIIIRSMEKTLRMFFSSLMKNNSNETFQQKVQQHLEHLKSQRQQALDDRKRAAPVEPTDGLSDAKRQRLEAGADGRGAAAQYPPLPSGPVSLAQVFTLNPDPRVLNFDVSTLPQSIVLQCVEPLLRAVPQAAFDDAVNAVRERWLSRVNMAQTSPGGGLAASAESVALPGSLIARQAHEAAQDEEDDLEAQGPIAGPALIPFRLAQPPPRTAAENDAEVQYRAHKLFSRLRAFSDAGTAIDNFLRKGPPASARRAANTDDRDSWAALMVRTALRGKLGRHPDGPYDEQSPYLSSTAEHKACFATLVREGLLKWVLENFRRRIDVAALWMNEEYVLQFDHAAAGDDTRGALAGEYDRWSLRLIDGMMPYIDANDWKYVTRFYSEVPAVSRKHVERLGRMAQDPDRVGCALKVLQYLILFKPPCREACLDVVEDMYKNNEPARVEAAKLLFERRRAALSDDDRDALDKAKADRAAAAAAAAKASKPAAEAPAATAEAAA